MDDIAPQLYEELKKYFDGLIDSDQKIKEIAKLINDGKGRYKDADDYAVRTGQLLSDSFREKLKSGSLPGNKMYYNIANRTVAPMLKDNHKRVTDMCSKVQKALNEANGLNLSAIMPDIDENYIKGIIDHITDIDDLEKLLDYLSDVAISYSQNVVDSSVRENARFQSESGLTARVYRHFRPGLTNQKAHHEKKYWKCPYCEERACPNGVPYEEVDGTGAWIWQRHPGCNCIIEYKPSRGFKQIVPPTRRREVQENLERAESSGRKPQSNNDTKIITNTPRKPSNPSYGCKDITERWFRNAKPGQGSVRNATEFTQDGKTYKIDGENVRFNSNSKGELKMAELWLKTRGGIIQIMPEVSGKYKNVSTPDYIIDGRRYDLKTIEGSSKSKIDSIVHQSEDQADNFIFDITKSCTLSIEELVKQAEGVFNSRFRTRVNSLIFVKNGEFLRILTRK